MKVQTYTALRLGLLIEVIKAVIFKEVMESIITGKKDKQINIYVFM